MKTCLILTISFFQATSFHDQPINASVQNLISQESR